MTEKRDNNRIVHLDAIFVVLILFFGLLIYNNSLKVNTGLKSNPVSSSLSVGEKNGITASVLYFVPLKTWAEIQKLTLTNNSKKTKKLKIF